MATLGLMETRTLSLLPKHLDCPYLSTCTANSRAAQPRWLYSQCQAMLARARAGSDGWHCRSVGDGMAGIQCALGLCCTLLAVRLGAADRLVRILSLRARLPNLLSTVLAALQDLDKGVVVLGTHNPADVQAFMGSFAQLGLTMQARRCAGDLSSDPCNFVEVTVKRQFPACQAACWVGVVNLF